MGCQLFEAHERRVADTFEDRGSERFDGSDHAAFFWFDIIQGSFD